MYGRGFYECFCVDVGGGGEEGPARSRPSSSEYFDLVFNSYAVVAIFSVACGERAAAFRFSVLFYGLVRSEFFRAN